mmetsp:Transcript_76991/g.164971  ORF Transcript_76991/g.164971 Transcript_76991/m.164971 type:complete len:218 (-) Transcript_76991:159-812(-)
MPAVCPLDLDVYRSRARPPQVMWLVVGNVRHHLHQSLDLCQSFAPAVMLQQCVQRRNELDGEAEGSEASGQVHGLLQKRSSALHFLRRLDDGAGSTGPTQAAMHEVEATNDVRMVDGEAYVGLGNEAFRPAGLHRVDRPEEAMRVPCGDARREHRLVENPHVEVIAKLQHTESRVNGAMTLHQAGAQLEQRVHRAREAEYSQELPEVNVGGALHRRG